MVPRDHNFSTRGTCVWPHILNATFPFCPFLWTIMEEIAVSVAFVRYTKLDALGVGRERATKTKRSSFACDQAEWTHIIMNDKKIKSFFKTNDNWLMCSIIDFLFFSIRGPFFINTLIAFFCRTSRFFFRSWYIIMIPYQLFLRRTKGKFCGRQQRMPWSWSSLWMGYHHVGCLR